MAADTTSVNLVSLEGETFEVPLAEVKLSEVVKIMVDQQGNHNIVSFEPKLLWTESNS